MAQKAGLNKAILDQGWGMFRRMLEYKQVWRGGEVIAVTRALPRRNARNVTTSRKAIALNKLCFPVWRVATRIMRTSLLRRISSPLGTGRG